MIGFLGHGLGDQSVKGINSTGTFAAAKELGAMHIHGRQIGPSSQPLVFVFDLHRSTRLGWQGGMDTAAGLHAGFLIGRDDKFIILKRLSLPLPLVEIQDPTGFESKLGVPRENPTSMLPRTDRILV